MADVATTEPTEITAGDTASWQISLADYPASAGWALAYALVSRDAVYSVSSTAAGDDHLVSLAASTTLGYLPGEYSWQAYVTLGAERYTLDRGSLTVLADLATQSAGIDTRTHAKKTLEALEAWIEGHDMAVADYQIAGRAMKYHSIPDLMQMRDSYRAEVRSEVLKASGGVANRLVVRFS